MFILHYLTIFALGDISGNTVNMDITGALQNKISAKQILIQVDTAVLRDIVPCRIPPSHLLRLVSCLADCRS
jgi:hypothetical protein